jgi:hypothetical protein
MATSRKEQVLCVVRLSEDYTGTAHLRTAFKQWVAHDESLPRSLFIYCGAYTLSAHRVFMTQISFTIASKFSGSVTLYELSPAVLENLLNLVYASAVVVEKEMVEKMEFASDYLQLVCSFESQRVADLSSKQRAELYETMKNTSHYRRDAVIGLPQGINRQVDDFMREEKDRRRQKAERSSSVSPPAPIMIATPSTPATSSCKIKLKIKFSSPSPAAALRDSSPKTTQVSDRRKTSSKSSSSKRREEQTPSNKSKQRKTNKENRDVIQHFL